MKYLHQSNTTLVQLSTISPCQIFQKKLHDSSSSVFVPEIYSLLTLEDQNVTGRTTNSRNPPSYSDAVSYCDIHCHKMVLSSSSLYFDTILATEIPGDGNSVLNTQLDANAYGSESKEFFCYSVQYLP